MRIALRLRQLSARSLFSVENASAALWASPPERLACPHDDDRGAGPSLHALRRCRGFAAEASPASQDDEEEQREIGNPRVRQLVDEIANLSLLDVSDLTTLLSKKLGVPIGGSAFGGFGGGFGGPMPGGPAAAAPETAAAAAPAVEEKTEFDVKLTGFDAAAKIKVIKEVRAMTELGLKEAKELVEKAPIVVKSGLKKDEAEELMSKLTAAGGKVSLE